MAGEAGFEESHYAAPMLRPKTAKTLILVQKPGIFVSGLSQPLPSGSGIRKSHWETGGSTSRMIAFLDKISSYG
jgi:hypothetical protein